MLQITIDAVNLNVGHLIVPAGAAPQPMITGIQNLPARRRKFGTTATSPGISVQSPTSATTSDMACVLPFQIIIVNLL